MHLIISLLLLAALSGCVAPAHLRESAPASRAGTVAPLGHPVKAPAPIFGDTRPHPWFGISPAHYQVHGIDVSRWQGEVDWETARAAGISFAFIKATEGGDSFNPLFASQWAGAGRAGIRRGAYHYYYFCRSPEEQARWFTQHVPRDPHALPHVLDLEWTPTSRTCPHRPDPASIRRDANTFLALLTQHYGKRPLIYTTVDFHRDTGIGHLPGTGFWLRSVAGHPEQVYPGVPWRFWQYTSTGLVPGVNGPVDINVFDGGDLE